jgi:uncharacterized SAM-binding protein YcdF (DUF218 family)
MGRNNLAAFSPDKSNTGIFKLLLKLALLLVLVWAGGLLHFAADLPTGIVEPGQKTDAIVVLTGGTKRIHAGATLLASAMASKMLISGVNPRLAETDIRRLLAEAKADTLLDCCITIDRQATDTVGNARETARWALKENISSLRLVTGSYHMPRSLLLIRTAAPRLKIVPHPVFSDKVKQAEWWKYPGTAQFLAWEYSKYLVRLLRIRLLGRI